MSCTSTVLKFNAFVVSHQKWQPRQSMVTQ